MEGRKGERVERREKEREGREKGREDKRREEDSERELSHFTLFQNAPSNFQTVLVATDVEEEDVGVNLDAAREFAREHQLLLIEVNLATRKKVNDAFSAIVGKIMQVYGKYRPSMSGKCIMTSN